MTNEDQALLARWVASHVAQTDQVDTYWLIRDFCRDHPDLPERHSWPEIRAMAERSQIYHR